MPCGRGHRHGPARGELQKLRREVETLKIEARSSYTGHFKKRQECIRMQPFNQFAKIYRTVRLVHGKSVPESIYCLPGMEPSTQVPRLQHIKSEDELSTDDPDEYLLVKKKPKPK